MTEANISNVERIGSIAVGSALIASGIVNILSRPVGSAVKFLAAGFLIWRGASGYCPVNDALGINNNKDNPLNPDYYPQYPSEDDYPLPMEQAY